MTTYSDEHLSNILNEPAVAYSASINDTTAMSFVSKTRKGISYQQFQNLVNKMSFSFSDWSSFLHLSERTLQRYKKNKTPFDPLQSERILQIVLLNRYGVKVFGSNEGYSKWLSEACIALGGILPKSLLDNTFGIELIRQELGRIEHGVLA